MLASMGLFDIKIFWGKYASNPGLLERALYAFRLPEAIKSFVMPV